MAGHERLDGGGEQLDLRRGQYPPQEGDVLANHYLVSPRQLEPRPHQLDGSRKNRFQLGEAGHELRPKQKVIRAQSDQFLGQQESQLVARAAGHQVAPKHERRQGSSVFE